MPLRPSHLLALAVAWAIADLAMPVLIRLSRRLRWLDRPRGHKTHRSPTPCLGGIGIYLGTAGGLAATFAIERPEPILPVVGIFLGGTMVMFLGALDDLRPLNALFKLGGLAAATLLIGCFGVSVSLFPGGAGNPLNLSVTLFWVVGVTSATNSLDHFDGATAGSMAIACGTVFLIGGGFLDGPSTGPSTGPFREAGPGGAGEAVWLQTIPLAVGGGCLGFLRHNLAGGRIFLGDNGSFLLGFLLASALVFARWSEDPLKAVLLPAVVLTVPLFDLALATALRMKSGVVGSIREAIVYCGKDHLAHRLSALGLGRPAVIAAIYVLGAIASGCALTMAALESRPAYLTAFGAHLALLLALGAVLDRAPVEPSAAPSSAASTSSP